jgi:hypothetical protein
MSTTFICIIYLGYHKLMVMILSRVGGVHVTKITGSRSDLFALHLQSLLKKAVFWDVAPCRSGVNRRFGGTYRLHIQGRGEKIRKSLLP